MEGTEKPTKIVNVFEVLRKVADSGPAGNGSAIDTCVTHIGDMFRGAMDRHRWALMMVDATAKLPEPLLGGLNLHLGDYDMCLKARSENFAGRYCLVQAMDQRIATCVPSTCTADTLAVVLANNSDNIISVPSNTCETADVPYGYHPASGMLGFVMFLAILNAFGWFMLTFDNIRNRLPEWCQPSADTAHAMSPVTAWKKITKTPAKGEATTLGATAGVRTLSIAWVVLGHREALMTKLPVLDKQFLPERLQEWRHVYVPAGLFAVDTFLLVAGCMLGYVFVRNRASHPQCGRNWLSWLGIFYLHRYIRLTPLLAFVILLYAGGLLYLGEGPLWLQDSAFDVNSCRTNWWPNFFYIQNYYNNRNMCVSHSWYLTVDMQLYLISPLLLFPLLYCSGRDQKRIGCWVYAAFFSLSIIIPFAIVAIYDIIPAPDLLGDTGKYLEHTEMIYIPTHARAAPWVVGVGLGMLIAKDLLEPNTRPKVAVLWMCVLLGGVLLPFGMTGSFRSGASTNRWTSALFVSLSKPLWALGVAAVIFLCSKGKGWILGPILNWNFFVVLSRLTYAVYLLHPAVQNIMGWSTRGTTVGTDVVVIPMAIADITITFIIAAIASLLFESPFIALEGLLLQKFGPQRSLIPSPRLDVRVQEPVAQEPNVEEPDVQHHSVSIGSAAESPGEQRVPTIDPENLQQREGEQELKQQQEHLQQDNASLYATSTTCLNAMH